MKNVLSNTLLFCFLILVSNAFSQNSLIAGGFGGRLWYESYNFSNGSYTAYTVCGDSNQLYGWGSNGHGELGPEVSIYGSNKPVKIPNMTNVAYYTAGYMSAAIKKDSTAWVWGKMFKNPTKIANNVMHVSAGVDRVVLVKYDGTVWTVGSNTSGSFGNPEDAEKNKVYYNPVKMKGVTNAVRVANGAYTTMVLLKDGSLLAVGNGAFGGLGNGTLTTVANEAIVIPFLKDIVDVKSSVIGNFALDKDGNVFKWGKLVHESFIPEKIKGIENVVAISTKNDGYDLLMLTENKYCYAMGLNVFKSIGVGREGVVEKPEIVASDVVDILSGESFSYIIKSDGSLWMTGHSNRGNPNNSIAMNRTKDHYSEFVKLEPTLAPMFLCKAKLFQLKVDEFTICQGDVVNYNGKLYTKEGLYFEGALIKQEDTVEPELKITVNPKNDILQVFDLCPNESVLVGEKTYSEAGEYIDTLVNMWGCDSVVTTRIDVSYEYCSEVFIPNVFTPNRDLKNDYFKFVDGDFTSTEGIIYNRWGEEVYRFNYPDQEFWNGNINNNGTPCPSGTYYYILNFRESPSKRDFRTNGVITLIRDTE